MPKFLSSIFSFDTLRLAADRDHGARRAWLVALVLVLGLECLCRVALEPIGRYWEYWKPRAAAKFEWYRTRAKRGGVPEVLFVGDSVAAHDFAPEVCRRELPPGTAAYNLAYPGNFPEAFRPSTLTLLEVPHHAPRVVVFATDPLAFAGGPTIERFEAAILASPYCRRQSGDWLAADYVFLARVPPAMPFRKHWFDGRGLDAPPPEAGYQPLRGIYSPEFRKEEKEAYDRSLDPKRVAVIAELADVARRRDFELLVVLTPRIDPSEFRRRIESDFLAAVGELQQTHGVAYVDLREPPFLRREHFADDKHLNRRGATLFSRFVASAIAERLAQAPKKTDSPASVSACRALVYVKRRRPDSNRRWRICNPLP